MASDQPSAPATPTVANRLFMAVFFLLLVATTFTFPAYPTLELDASWRMALAQFLHDGRQFGKDVVFTYGPLGFLMGRTYYGLYFWPMILWELGKAVLVAILIFRQGRSLTGYTRAWYLGFFLLFGVIYDDALQMLIIALLGFALIPLSGREARWREIAICALLAVFALVKFTNFMLAAFAVGVAGALELWRRRPAAAIRLGLWFGIAYVGGWAWCGQNPLNLFSYIRNSLEVSQGYQAAMGLPAPDDALWKGVTMLVLLATYAVIYWRTQTDRARATAYVALLAALIYLNWKHGFVRADGHMIGFFICALLPTAAFPALMEDAPANWKLQRSLLAIVAVLGVMGIYNALPWVVRGAFGNTQEKVWSNIQKTLDWAGTRQTYRDRITAITSTAALPKSLAIIGKSTVDAMGHDQAYVLLNRLNYHPRPVFQGYSAYTPRLAELNYNYYAGPDAPEYVLLKLQTIDGRLVIFDDSRLYPLLVHRYSFVHAENGYQLWRRHPDAFDAAAVAPRPLRGQALTLNQPVPLADLAAQPTWATIDVRLSLLGKLRAFFCKPPAFSVIFEDMQGNKSTYRLPLPQGRAGFILNPLVEDIFSYMQFAGDKPERRVRSITATVAPDDQRFFQSEGRIEISALKPSTAGLDFFSQAEKARFHMFKSFPISHDSHTPPSEEKIDGQTVIVMHAPSEMIFNAPVGATEISGQFGFIAGAYSKGGNTNGAEFVVTWTAGGVRTELFRRLLDPVHKPADGGLQSFSVKLPPSLNGARISLQVGVGPFNDNSWDWTAWTGIEIK